MPVKECFVTTCGNTSENNKNKLFIILPRRPELRMKWFTAVNRKYLTKTELYCCEDHFDLKTDMKNWMQYKLLSTRAFMNENAIPRFFIKSPIPDSRKFVSQISDSSKKRKRDSVDSFTEQAKRLARRRIDFKNETSVTSPNLSETKEDPSDVVIPAAYQTSLPSTSKSIEVTKTFSVSKTNKKSPYFNNKISPVPEYIESPSGSFLSTGRKEVLPSVENCYFVLTEPLRGVDKQCQVNIRPKYRSIAVNTRIGKAQLRTVSTNTSIQFKSISSPQISPSKSSSISTMSSDPWISSNSGTSSCNESDFENYNDLSAYINRTKFLMQTKSRFYLGVPEDTYFIVDLLSKHTSAPVDHILICLKKIRLNDPNSRLADEFGISDSYVAKIFHKTVPMLAQFLKKLIFWQPSAHVRSMLPISFRYRYSKVQSIIDCFEIEIEIPSDPVKQAMTWSQYKKCNTMKYLISATPHGFINFISPGFGGRATDKVIVEFSGYLDTVPHDTQVMADRGFKQVVSLLATKNCTLVRPPSVAADHKSSKSEVKESKRIAALRIHIERVIRRLREFHILKMHSCVNHKILYLLDHMILIACGMINLQHVLIK